MTSPTLVPQAEAQSSEFYDLLLSRLFLFASGVQIMKCFKLTGEYRDS